MLVGIWVSTILLEQVLGWQLVSVYILEKIMNIQRVTLSRHNLPWHLQKSWSMSWPWLGSWHHGLGWSLSWSFDKAQL